MAYSDKDLREFTQIAYTDFSSSAEDLLKDTNGNGSSSGITLEKLEEDLRKTSDHPDIKYNITDSQRKDWKIVSIHDTNARNGFYACIVETSPGNAVVCFRGSEDPGKLDNVINDWIYADFGLLNSTCTNQQAEVERFLADNKDLLSKYDNITMTGHSLGGNLAEYATIMSYKYGLNTKIKQCVSMDGPGFSDEFINANKEHIADMKGVMKHYRWSVVGDLLCDLPGVTYQYVQVNENKVNEEHSALGALVQRHDTKYLEYDDNGNLILGKQHWFANVLGKFSKYVELNPNSYLGNLLITAINLNSIINYVKEYIKNASNNQSANYLKINSNQLLSDADDMSFEIEEILREVRSVYDEVQALGAMWQGTASDKFAKSFGDEYTKINEYLTELKKCVDHVKVSAEDYNSCEQQVYSMVDSIRV